MAATQSTKQWNSLYFEIPLNGATASMKDFMLTISGPMGETSKEFKYPNVSVTVEGDIVKIGTDKLSRRENKIIKTFKAHVENLVKGVTQGFEYKLRVVYSKFPVTVEMNGKIFTIKNLLGERQPRTLEVPEHVSVEVKGSDITVKGINKEHCGQVAASLEQLSNINHLDRRVVQDGIYIIEKPHVAYV